jgi:hypothetical protein
MLTPICRANIVGTGKRKETQKMERHITAGELRLESVLHAARLVSVRIAEEVNAHIVMEARVLCEPETRPEDILRTGWDSPVRLLGPSGEVLFDGLCAETAFSKSGEYTEAELKAVSRSVVTDRERKSRTFRKIPIGIGEFCENILSAYAEVEFIADDGGKTIDRLIVQNDETDFELLLRLSREAGLWLVADCGAARPRLRVGLPAFPPETDFDGFVFETGRDLTRYREELLFDEETVNALDYTWHRARSGIYLRLGDAVRVKGRAVRVAAANRELVREELVNTYTLEHRRGGSAKQPILPLAPGRLSAEAKRTADAAGAGSGRPVRGGILTGTVVSVSGMAVDVHFDIDGDGGGETMRADYASDVTNAVYTMPGAGEKVAVIYNGDDGKPPVAFGAVRTNGGDAPDTSYKIFSAGTRQIRMTDASLEVTGEKTNLPEGDAAPAGPSVQLLIRMNDDEGIRILSKSGVSLRSEGDISVKAETVGISAPLIELVSGRSSITAAGNIDIKSPLIEVTTRLSQSAETVSEENYTGFDAVLDGLQFALDVAGMFPAVGIVADVVNAGISVLRGDMTGAALSLISAIPVVGDAFGAAKLAVKTATSLPNAGKLILKTVMKHPVGSLRFLAGAYGVFMGFRGATPTLEAAKELAGMIASGEFSPQTARDFFVLASSALGAFGLGLRRGRGRNFPGKPGDPGTLSDVRIRKPKPEPKNETGTNDNTKPPEVSGVAKKPPDEKDMHDAVFEWANMQLKLVPSARRASKFNTASVAFDSNTEKYYYGMNQGLKLSGDALNRRVSALLPEKSLNSYPVGNCAEVDAINQAINDNAHIRSLYVYTIDIISNETKPPCANCRYAFDGVVASLMNK